MRKFYIGALALFAIASLALTFGGGHEDFWKNYKPVNLKVLPKDINPQQLHSIMESFSDALDVHCSFCHALNKDGKHLDFGSDANHKKDVARGMMKMVQSLNKKHFLKYQKGKEKVHEVSCITCHNGHKMPQMITTKRDSIAF